MAKEMVRKSLSPCDVLASFVPKKNGSVRMHMDNKAINKITIKYTHSIPILEDMLDELYGLRVFKSTFEEWLLSNQNQRG